MPPPPKKGKEAVYDENSWRVIIEDTPLDEEDWQVKVILIEAAGSDQDRIFLNKFETYAAEEKRFVIKNICKTETVFMVNQLGSEKKVKDDNYRVFEEGNSYLKDKRDIPPDVLALIIKHLILKMKEEYLFIKRQRLEVREGMRRESATMVDRAEVRGTVSGIPSATTDAAPTPAPAPANKSIGQLPVSPEGKKFNTSLRERGEEWRDKVYVDDYPTDGPNLYVAITGFVEPFLPGCLVKIGIPLTAVVQVRIDPTATTIPSSLNRPTKRGQSQTEMLTDLSLKFWDNLQLLRIQAGSADDFKNTAFVVFSPPYWSSDDLSGDPDRIYDELCYLMYDIQDLSRQHIHYLENMDLINIPQEVADEHNDRIYHGLIDDIPLECITIYSVLDSVLATVCSGQNYEDSSKTSLSAAVTLNAAATSEDKYHKAEDLVTEVFNTLCKTETNRKQYRLTYGKEYESHKDPIIIKYGDFAKYNTFHLGNINLDQIVFSSLLGMPVHNLWTRQDRPTTVLEAKVNFHINVLLSCFNREDVETSELNRLIHILACRKLYNNRSSIKKRHLQPTTITDFKKVYLKRSVLAEPLPTCPSITASATTYPSFPSMTKTTNTSEASYGDTLDPEVQRIKFLFDCPDISELVSAAEIANDQPIKHMIDDFEFFEDFSGISAFQIMSEAFNKFNCVDYKYCEVTDCFILMFFNSHDKDGIARDEWRCHLCTPLCLQDFFDYILEEHYDWIQNEEKIYDENLLIKLRSESKDFIDPSALKSCVENTDVDMDLLMEGSLKYQELVKAEEGSQEATEVDDAASKKNTMSAATTVDDKSSRKTKSPANISPKNVRQSYENRAESSTAIKPPPKPFLGYDLGDRRVEVFGKDATYFSRDGTQVSSLYSLIIPMNLEYIILNITPGNGFNSFWVHKALGEFVNPAIIEACESFRITTKDQVMINIRKRTYEMPAPAASTSSLDDNDKKSMFKSVIASKVSVDQAQVEPETSSFYSLFLTWPNGMITETVHEKNSSNISHIKQYHVCPMPNLDEDFRCISLNGEVIIFKVNGDIDVLKPDGSLVKIKKYFKKPIFRENADDLISEDPSEKSKKNKLKAKTSKPSSKSSKNALSDDDKIPDEKSVEYELVIEEFETIESSGVRQRHVRDIATHIEKLLIRTATDHCLGEVFSRRMDGTSILLNKDGLLVATFPNKTRIITQFMIDDEEIYPEWTDEERELLGLLESDIDVINSRDSMSQRSFMASTESATSKKLEEEEIGEKARTDGYVSIHVIYTVEHVNFSTVTINKFNGKISIDSPNDTTVVVDTDNNYNIKLDAVTNAHFDGDNLDIAYEACPECRSFTSCHVKITPENDISDESNWVKVKDSFCKKLVVNYEGNIILLDELCSTEAIPRTEEITDPSPELSAMKDVAEDVDYVDTDDRTTDGKSETSVTSHGKCREMYLAKTIKFFVLKRDLTCSELVHRALLEHYKRACRWQPWCSINQYDTFEDYRSMLSILTPVHLTESEKWLMESKLADKPKYLTYMDLKKDTGKGFYHWMRPYERFVPKPMKPENVLPPGLPRAFVLRTLEQQWGDSKREELKGARELLEAVLRYRAVMEADSETLLNVPILDPRPEAERRIDDMIQNLAHKIYEELREKLADDVQTRAKATITTTPAAPEPEEMYVEGEFGEEFMSESRQDEEREISVRQLDQTEEMSPNLRRYWRRRAEEYKEEEFYKYLLREGVVPPYFRNVLGGAIWWEMNHMTDEAVTKAERRQMKCVCGEDSKTPTEEITTGYTVSAPFIQ
ncbi:uncharacterized protein LOC142986712 [Anticarsia gemmatalis]|uniref:uncharacterized protein LOC142986712 n=1 Tax=Anticarsia gemmatalis TaxID=129554 RepID=UPI003F76D187